MFFFFQEADLFLGDVALTYERANFAEFSFITLADSGAFVTHAPSKLNEALALLRPFHWQVRKKFFGNIVCWPDTYFLSLRCGQLLE